MTDILDKHDLQYMLTDKCKASDHAIVSVSFSVTSLNLSKVLRLPHQK